MTAEPKRKMSLSLSSEAARLLSGFEEGTRSEVVSKAVVFYLGNPFARISAERAELRTVLNRLVEASKEAKSE